MKQYMIFANCQYKNDAIVKFPDSRLFSSLFCQCC